MEWLAEWIRQQLGQNLARSVNLPGSDEPAMYLHGSIGYDTALTMGGEVWVTEYDVDGPAAPQEQWRLAGPTERIGYLVIAARRRAEINRLLPKRPIASLDCEHCDGTGEWRLRANDGTMIAPIAGMICKECGGLGWSAG